MGDRPARHHHHHPPKRKEHNEQHKLSTRPRLVWGRLKPRRVLLSHSPNWLAPAARRLQHELAPIVLISGQRKQGILDLAYL